MLMFWVMVIMIPTALVLALLQACGRIPHGPHPIHCCDYNNRNTGICIWYYFYRLSSSAFGLKWFRDRPQQRWRSQRLKTFSPRCHHRALWAGLYRADDAGLDGRSDDRTIYPDRPAQGCEFPVHRSEARIAERADCAVHGDHVANPVAAERCSDRGNPVQL